MEVFIVAIIVAVVLGFIMIPTAGMDIGQTPSQALNQKFVSLGTLTGKTLAEIEPVVGLANSTSSLIGANGEPQILRQWIEPAYHICLLFDANGICLGVSSETRINE